MRSRSLALATAAAVTVSGILVPAASAEQREVTNEYIADNFHSPFTLPEKSPEGVILQVGGNENEAMLNWVTQKGITGQSVQFAPEGADVAKGEVVDATSKDSVVSLTEGKLKNPEVEPVFNTIAEHKATISGLKPGTSYSYRVGSEQDGWSDTYTFKTDKADAEKWNFLLFGDVQLYSTKDLKAQTKGWDDNVTKATKQFPDTSFILSAGDQANHSALHEHEAFISPDELRSYRTAVNMGNHDNYYAPSYEAMYNLPNQEDENYWFTHNNALIISLDSNDWEDLDDDVDFLRRTVKEQGEGKDWVIVTYHHSTFSQAYHQEDRGIMYWRERMTPVLSELDVDLVLGGHDHIYARSHLMNGYTPVDSGREAKIGETLAKKPGEVQYITTNSGSGSKYYQFFDFKTGERDEDTKENFDQTVKEKTIRDYTALWDQQEVPNYTNVEVTPEGLKVSTFAYNTGDRVDEFTLTRAADDAGQADQGKGDQDPQEGGSSDNTLAIALGVLAGLLAILGGGAWAAQQGLIPGVNLDNLLP
ncbi:fibronectin type III domain-containing protein [Corynebacterium hadale]|uniref:FN3 domain-containing metallophosphoesterase family protein n=1 Tax=Corynebacterium hadale TaxID=2026255 RepID=UPI001EF3D1B9|nr:FN3 domain-containing metallophosphoesterase family protein [Corynebacterium hadale]MCG7254960.1 fibronectin type III domain-containing protein [Corynebacterium hadale]MCG7257147.1 fibronectin type III domain-containing protein [Corynebacterium hadale]MCG7265830.1 fibronectin type III domain-containing protein [Corynebacterium hadale]